MFLTLLIPFKYTTEFAYARACGDMQTWKKVQSEDQR